MESKQKTFGKWARYSGFVFAISVILLVPFTKPAQSATQTARRSDAFVDSVGVNTHLSFSDTAYHDKYPLVRDKLSILGVRHVRDGAYLLDHQIAYDRYREMAADGLRFNLIVQNPQDSTSVDKEIISTIARKGGSGLEFLEGPNEYDIKPNRPDNWPNILRSYQRSLYNSVKSNGAISNTPVLGSSLASAYAAHKVGDLSGYLQYGNAHSYFGGSNPGTSGWATGDGYYGTLPYYVSEARKISGNKPIISTETGYSTALKDDSHGGGISERAMSKYVPRSYLEHFDRGFKRTYGYELIDQFPDAEKNEREKNFGLLRNDGTAKPVYTSLKNLIDLLEDPGPNFRTKSLNYSLSGNTGGVHRTLLQKRDGRFYLVLWLEKSSFNTDTKKDISVPSQQVKLTLNTQISKASTYLPNRSSSPIKQYASPKQITLDVPDHPLVVELTPSNNTIPKINNLRPGSNKAVRDRTPTIAATVRDRETNLRKRHIALVVDGNKKSRFSYNRSTDRLKFTPRKKLKGSSYHKVKIVARDPRGPNKARTWKFKVR